MIQADELKALADRVAKGPPSRELDLECEKALRGIMAHQTHPGRYSDPRWATTTCAELRRRAALLTEEVGK